MSRLAGKIAVVTGGAGAIGRATVHRLSSEGASVVVVGGDGEKAEALAEELTRQGRSAIGRRADVTSEDDVRALFEDVRSRYGGVDILHNNAVAAGGAADDQGLLKMSFEQWGRTMAVNLRGVMLCCRSAVPLMVDRGGGSIINMSSALGGVFTTPAFTAYSTSKAAQLGLTRQVATEFGKSGVRCNAIAPGLVLTEAARKSFPAYVLAQQEAENLVRFVATPEHIAGIVAFLASEDAAFVTGHVLVADGGRSVGRFPARPSEQATDADLLGPLQQALLMKALLLRPLTSDRTRQIAD